MIRNGSSLWSVLSIAVVAGASILAVALTGGAHSPVLPLIYLPVILGIVRYSLPIAIAIGVVMSLVMALAIHHGTDPAESLLRALTLNMVTVAGAFYAAQVQRERDALRLRVSRQEALLSASQIVNVAEKLDQALDAALLMLHTQIPHFRTAAIFLTDESERFMERAAATGAAAQQLSVDRLSLTDAAWLPTEGRPHCIPDTRAASGSALTALDPGASSLVCVSLRSLRVPIGLIFISADRPNAFSQDQLDMLQEFADSIGFPLQRIRVQEGLQGLAFTDGLTGLCNFRSFRSHLDDELKRSHRYARALSLVILDLDGFKAVNDEYGHPAGDQMLIGVANVIRHTVREIDLPVRYGGEEFAIICPETPGPETAVLAERIRASVAAARFQVLPGVELPITISAGVATYPHDATESDTLIKSADTALYEAKRNGKNRVIMAASLKPSPEK